MKLPHFRAFITVMPTFKPGDQPPEGYLQWHEWAEVQRKAGIEQVVCCKCCKWKTPQELSGKTMETKGFTSKGAQVKHISPICNECDR